MQNSAKTIIQHIPDFLDYCETRGLKNNTRENYRRYLNKFIEWLETLNLTGILPHQLTPERILGYKLYLSEHLDPKTGKSLTKGTQNYYLIALRALLGYFVAKNVVSLLPDKVALPGHDKASKTAKFFSLDQIDVLLNAPQGTSPIILRNRAILHTIVSTGFKVRQLTNLNRDSVIDLPNNILPYLNDYLKTRSDEEKALFINYSGKKISPRRLTVRMVEKIIKKYGALITSSDLINVTPETLRSANILAVWNKTIVIKNLLWQNVEDDIKEKIIFLIEPILNYGKADISIMKSARKSIYIEVGTVSLFKVWYNLMVMPNCIFILVPSDDFVIKLEN